MRETESKIRLFDTSISNQLDQIEIAKKEIFAQMYDNNVSHSNKFQLMNESLIEKFEDYDKIISRFQENLLKENSNFTEYISEQIESHQRNNKKLFEYISSDLQFTKDKVIFII